MVQHFSVRDTVGDDNNGILFSFFVPAVTLNFPESRMRVVHCVAVGITLSNLFRSSINDRIATQARDEPYH